MVMFVDDLTIDDTVVGKLKSLTLKLRFEGKSLMKVKNNKGPSTVPWGTPEVTSVQAEDSPRQRPSVHGA